MVPYFAEKFAVLYNQSIYSILYNTVILKKIIF